MADDYIDGALNPVHSFSGPAPVKRKTHEQEKGSQEQHNPEPEEPEEAANHFADLAQAAEVAHQKLKAANSPYRFCVYREGVEVFIDIVLLKADGSLNKLARKNITHAEFFRWLEAIESGEGLFIEREG